MLGSNELVSIAYIFIILFYVCKLQLFVIYHVYGTYNFIVRKKIAFE